MITRSRVAAAVLWALIIVAIPVAPALPQAQPSAATVLAALDTLQSQYVDPVDPIGLLNAAIDGLRQAAHLTRDALPGIPGGASAAAARLDFQATFTFAVAHSTTAPADLATAAVNAMLASLHDSHTHFMTDQERAEVQRELADQAAYAGAGMRIGQVQTATKTTLPVVLDVFPGSPAAAAGVRRFDVIAAVDGHPMVNLPMANVRQALRGAPGTVAELTLARQGNTVHVAIRRARITIHPVWSYLADPHTAVVRLYDFSQDAGTEIRRALAALPAGVAHVILDLRGDEGGYIIAARSVDGAFLPAGTVIARTRDRSGTDRALRVTGPMVYSGPLTVLIDQGTASAGEITTAALHDNHRAVLVGQTTAGALGGAEEVPLPGGAMSVTVLRILSPLGAKIEGVGIAPDVAVPLTDADILAGDDAQLDAAIRAETQGPVISRASARHGRALAFAPTRP